MNKKLIVKSLVVIFILMQAGLAFCAGGGNDKDLPKEGTILPDLTFPIPVVKKDIKNLGLDKSMKTFKLKDLNCDVVLLEVVGVYCPICFEQAPLFNKLFKRIKKKKLSKKVKFIGIAAGANAALVDAIRKSTYKFPVVADEDMAINKKLGGPGTPFSMLVKMNGDKAEVIYTHKGLDKDIGGLYKKIKASVK